MQVTWCYELSPSGGSGTKVTESFEWKDICAMRLLGALGWVRGRHRPGVRPTTGAATVTGNTSFADARDGDNNTATVAATPARPRAPKHPQYPTRSGPRPPLLMRTSRSQ